MNRVYLAMLAALFVGLMLYGFGLAEEDAAGKGTTPSASEAPKASYTREAMIEQISDGCVSGMVSHGMAEPVSRDYCTCYATEVTGQLSIEDFSRIGLSGPTGNDRDVMETAGQGCAQKIIEAHK